MATASTHLAAGDLLYDLARRVAYETDLAEAAAALSAREPATLDGVWGSACALASAALAERAPGMLLVVAADGAALDDLRDDLRLFTPREIDSYPAWETAPEDRVVYDEVYGERLGVLKRLLAGRPPGVLVTSIQALVQPAPAVSEVAAATRMLQVGQQVDLDELCGWLVTRGFHAATAIELPGEFSLRGGILDLFAPDWEAPARVELFGDEIESIRRFDIGTQRSLDRLDQLDLTVLPTDLPRTAHLADYLPADAWVLVVEPARVEDEGAAYLSRVERPELFHSVAAVLAAVQRRPCATAAQLAAGALGAHVSLRCESVEQFSLGLDKVRRELEAAAAGGQAILVCPTEAESQRLGEIFAGGELLASGRLKFIVGRLSAGFRLRSLGVLLLGAGELFHRTEVRRTVRRHLGQAIDSFFDLREGDLVVHLAHGIGRYRGLHRLEKNGQIEEHLQLEFRGGTRLYVPATKIGLVQKYIGGARQRPLLAQLGGALWQKQKAAAEAAVQDLAVDMLDLHAQRVSRPGVSLGPDSDWQREFDASFPYHETADQLAAIGAIKHDQQSPRPMDRLLCGDVGFGKTEVAMRAAFKAVDSGFQVAVLTPTTILCEQHYHSFRERMAEFPFDIGRLSRFSSPQEQRETLAGLKSGQVDIVVGTHRVASRDVRFHNLGLVIIDEEQRFGVEVKERLKSLRSTVDVLTLSATPIPRTLHMSLVGLRDISNLETPPEDRLAVETRVTRFSNELVRHAILRELNRGGQTYFVHNRVNDIEAVARRLRDIVPEANIRIGHGQMPEEQLEQVMVDFVAGRFDVLLATTIVESGLDIPNANTIFIDEADRYGLADLHQLRGRVGRYKHRAYCYLLVEPHKHLTPNAARRLRAIEEYSQMGAGFAIAMRDLEIRGAGNLLGSEQSGHIATVGYEYYCQLLESSVRRLRREPPKLTLDVDIDLPLETYLPDNYVPDLRAKIDLYRRLTRVASDQQLADFRAELNDRFGPPPPPVVRLLMLTDLKIDAAVWQIVSLTIEDRYLKMGYAHRGRIEQLARATRGQVRVVDDQFAYVTLPQPVMEPESLVAFVKSVLRAG